MYFSNIFLGVEHSHRCLTPMFIFLIFLNADSVRHPHCPRIFILVLRRSEASDSNPQIPIPEKYPTIFFSSSYISGHKKSQKPKPPGSFHLPL